jgi:hypothetical protein
VSTVVRCLDVSIVVRLSSPDSGAIAGRDLAGAPFWPAPPPRLRPVPRRQAPVLGSRQEPLRPLIQGSRTVSAHSASNPHSARRRWPGACPTTDRHLKSRLRFT